MSSYYSFLVILLGVVIALPRNVSAGSDPGPPGEDVPAAFPGLWNEYLRICKTTKKDTPEYRAAIERALATLRERGASDDFEFTVARQLGLSYRNAKEYAKSSEILTAIIGKANDPESEAYVLLLLGLNAADSNNVSGAYKILEEAVAKYPKTGAGQTAQAELEKPIYGQYSAEPQRSNGGSVRGFFVCANVLAVLAIIIFVIISVRRQIKERGRWVS